MLDTANVGDDQSAEQQGERVVLSGNENVRDALMEYTKRFETRFGNTHPCFFAGSLQDAKDSARSVDRPLALYIHSDSSIACNIFPEKVLCAEAVRDLLDEQFVTWVWDVTENEDKTVLFESLRESISVGDQLVVELAGIDLDQYPVIVCVAPDGRTHNDTVSHIITASHLAEEAEMTLLQCMSWTAAIGGEQGLMVRMEAEEGDEHVEQGRHHVHVQGGDWEKKCEAIVRDDDGKMEMTGEVEEVKKEEGDWEKQCEANVREDDGKMEMTNEVE